MPENRGRNVPAPPEVAELPEVLAESVFEASHGRRPPSHLVRSSPRHVWSLLTERLMSRARIEHLGFDDPSVLASVGMPDDMMALGVSGMDGMLGRGVRVRQLTTPAGIRSVDPACPTIQNGRGGEASVVDALPFKAAVFDRSLVVLPVDLTFLPAGMLVLTDPVVVEVVSTIHRTLWAAGTRASVAGAEPPPRLQPVVEQLASGITDERAAERLGLSYRTYSRRVAELLDLLGVASRFEAGAEAARRGWTGERRHAPERRGSS